MIHAREATPSLTLRAWRVALTLVATSVAPAAAQQGLSFPTLPADLAVGDGRTQPCLDHIQGEAVCGRFRVHENRVTRQGRTIDVAFVVLKALHDRGYTDAFTQFNGGPGVDATPAAPRVDRSPLHSEIRQDRDILLIDHRGTGHSAALLCDNPFPRGIPSRFETVFPLDHVEACRDMLATRADLSQYHTPNAMDDLAELAAWLGYTHLNLSGGSYGTREAQIFARRHPDMVRTVILNAAAPVDVPIYVLHARELQRALDNMVAECGSQPACRQAYPDLQRVLDGVLTTAKENPATVTVEGTTVRFGIGPLSYALRGLLYGRAGAVPARIYDAHEGNWQPLAEYYLGRQAWVGAADGTPAGYHFSALCAEDVDPVGWDDIARQTAGTFMGDFLIGGYKRVCERWPSVKHPPSYFTPVRSDKPALILSGERDPVTPVSTAEIVASGWSNSLHVIVPNGGHGQGGPCINAMILRVIRTASIGGIDTSCAVSPPPTEFVLRGR